MEEYDHIQTTPDLGKLFVVLDQVVLGDRKDCAPFVNALRVLGLALTTRQPLKQSLPNFVRDFESRMDLLEPKAFGDDDHLSYLMSPVLLYATHFAQELYYKEYSKCTMEEQLKVRKAANIKVRTTLFLMLSHNDFGSHNKGRLKEKHNPYLGGQDM